MAVVNKIGKVMKRNHALVTFDQERIMRAIRRAADSIGGFEQDYLQDVNDWIFSPPGRSTTATSTVPIGSGTETVWFLQSFSAISSRIKDFLRGAA